MLKFDKKALLYGISAMSCSMLHCIFVSFYIDYFVRQNIMGIGGESDLKQEEVGSTTGNKEQQQQASTLNWFIVGQFVYAAWNALNDLGFGWLSDTSYAKVKKIIGVGVAAKQSASSSTPRFLKPILFTVKRFLPSTAALSRRRLSRVAVGGPLWAAAFAFLWYPTPFLRNISPALELSVKMIIYDGFFSYTTVSFRALLVDITTDGAQRELCNVYASVGHVIGSIGVMLASQLFEAAHQTTSSTSSSSSAYGSAGAAATTIMMPDGVEDGGHVDLEDVIASLSSSSPLNPSTIQNNLGAFRTFCFFWACAAAIGFILSATAEGNKEVVLLSADSKSHAFEDEKKKQALEETKRKKDGDDGDEGAAQPSISFTAFVSQTIRRAGMITVLIVWFLQDYSCTFATNFFSLFLTLVAAPHISPFARSVLLLVSFIVPHIITIAATPFIPTLGKKFLVSLYLGIRTIVGVLFLFLIVSLSGVSSSASSSSSSSSSSAPMLSAPQTFVFATLLLLNRVLTEAVCRTQGLIISDVCDEDTISFNRPASMAGAIHGLVNVVSRPSQSVSPVLSCLYLASYGVLMPKEGEKEGGGASYHGAVSTAMPICKLLAVTIIVTTIVMQVVWRLYYNLDGSYLSSIRMQMAMRSGGKAQRAEEGAVTPRKRRGSESAGGEADAGGVLVAKRGDDLGQAVTARPIQNRVGNAPLQGGGANSRASQII